MPLPVAVTTRPRITGWPTAPVSVRLTRSGLRRLRAEALEELLHGVLDGADRDHLERVAQLVGRVDARLESAGLAGDAQSDCRNGTELYYEIRGAWSRRCCRSWERREYGGHFDALADVLADEFTLVSYDRRGNGRSATPDGWETTSPEEQADDAAALLDALETVPGLRRCSARAAAVSMRCV